MKQPMTLSSQRGISMIETLIAVLILAVGLLGVAGMQTANIRNSQSASLRTMATILVSNMAERIRANSTLARTGAYALSKTCTIPTSGGPIQSVEKANWLGELQTALGAVSSTCGEVLYDNATRRYTITVSWDDSRAQGGSTAMSVTQMVSL